MRSTLVWFWLLIPVLTIGQDLRFEASVDSRKVVVGQQFQLTFTATSSQSVSLQNFTPPDFSKFVVLSGPMESSQYQWINGRASSSLSYVYVLTVQKPGKYTIGPASVEYKGTRFTSTPIEIEGVQGTPGQTGGQAAAQQSGLPADLSENLFIKAETNKLRVKQGEQFNVTYKLYTRVNIENYTISKAPTYEGFWAEDFDQAKSPQITTEVIDGKQFRVAILKRTALFATQAGKLAITPLEVRCAVQLRRKSPDPFDIFNDPLFSRLKTEEIDFASNGLSITVDPLPGPPPPDFNGAVGEYAFSASIDRKEVKTGDAVTLRLTVSGTGNVKLVRIPEPVFPGDFETYEPQLTEKISREGNLISGSKTAEYLFVPRNEGERIIEAVSFVYYDLKKKSYVPIRSQRFVITIAPGKPVTPGSGLTASKEDVRLLGQDIRFLKLSPGSFRRMDELGAGGTWFFIGMIAPPLVFIGAFMFRKRQEKMLGNSQLVRARKAGREASRQLKAAVKILARGDTESYHAEVSRALFRYVSDKFHIPPATLGLDTVADVLRGRKVSEGTIDRLRSCIERAEYARFAPGADTQEARRDLLDAARTAIDEVERALDGKS